MDEHMMQHALAWMNDPATEGYMRVDNTNIILVSANQMCNYKRTRPLKPHDGNAQVITRERHQSSAHMDAVRQRRDTEAKRQREALEREINGGVA